MTTHEPSAARRMLGGFADKLADVTDEVLFGDIWERTELSPATAASSRSRHPSSAATPSSCRST